MPPANPRKKTNEADDTSQDRLSGRVARNRLRIAWMYYVEGLTQGEIAERLGIGRVTVTRNLAEALRQREVKIWIAGGLSKGFELESALRHRFQLTDAIVVPAGSSDEVTSKLIGAATGMYISGLLKNKMRIGVGWGATLHEALQTLSPPELQDMEVISLLGGILQAKRYNPGDFASAFAKELRADCYLVQAPALVDSAATKKALVERCGLDAVLARADQLDLLLLSAGSMDVTSTTFRFDMVNHEERQELLAKGAVGNLLYNFYDREGRLIDHALNRRVMSAGIAQLRLAKLRLLASGGVGKVEAVRGALGLAAINHLITDEVTAKALLGQEARTS